MQKYTPFICIRIIHDPRFFMADLILILLPQVQENTWWHLTTKLESKTRFEGAFNHSMAEVVWTALVRDPSDAWSLSSSCRCITVCRRCVSETAPWIDAAVDRLQAYTCDGIHGVISLTLHAYGMSVYTCCSLHLPR